MYILALRSLDSRDLDFRGPRRRPVGMEHRAIYGYAMQSSCSYKHEASIQREADSDARMFPE